jgi:hypothetical protein
MKTFKQIVHGLSKIVGGLAAVVFLFAPFTNTGLTLMAVSIVVGLVCLPVYTWSEPDDEPEDPN